MAGPSSPTVNEAGTRHASPRRAPSNSPAPLTAKLGLRADEPLARPKKNTPAQEIYQAGGWKINEVLVDF